MLRLSFLLSLFVCHSALAQTGSLVGRVTDDTGKGLHGASIILEDAERRRQGTASDSEGHFEMDGLQPGSYRLTVTHVGYSEHTRDVAVAVGERVEALVQLTQETIAEQEVVVTAKRARHQLTPVTFSNITPRELEEQPAMKDLPVLLATLPSTTYYSENGNGIGYSTLRMRGFDQRRIAVSINGIPQNDPEDFNVFWINFFDIQGAVTDIQVQRGAGASSYGSTAIGGAVNIVAHPYKSYPYAEVEAGAGAFGTRRYTVEANTGLLGDRYVAFGRFSRLLSDGYRDWSWAEFYRFFGGVVRYGERSTFTVQAYGGPQEDGLAFSGIPKAANEEPIEVFGAPVDRRFNFSSFTRDRENFHQPHVEVFHDWRFSPRATLQQSLFWVKGEGYFDFGATFRSPNYLRLPPGYRGLNDFQRNLPLFIVAPDAAVLFRAYLDQWQIGWLPQVTVMSGAGETTVGGEARLHRSLRWGRMEEASGVPSELVGPEHDVRVYSFRGEKVISSVYGRHLWRLGDVIAVQGDLQLTFQQYRVYDEAFFGTEFEKPYLFLNPRIGVTLHPERPFSAYTSIALANREPRMKDLYDGEEAGAGFLPRFERRADGSFDFGDALVEPEQLVDLEVGGSWRGARYRAAANVFWMEFRDEIVPSGGLDQFGVPRSGNAERSRHIGLELEAAVQATKRLDLFGNATISRNRFIEFDEAVVFDEGFGVVARDGNPIAGFPDRIANLGLRYAVGGATARVSARYAGEQHIDNSGSNEDPFVVDPYLLLNASLIYEPDFVDGLRLALDVNNVLDEKVLLFGNVGPTGPQFFPAATRHVFFSVRYRLQ